MTPSRPVPPRYREATELLPPLDQWDGTRGVFLTGPVGSGKTYQAAALVNRTVGWWASVQWWNAVELFDAIRQSFNEPSSVVRDVKECSLLVLDDLGAHRATEWVEEVVYSVVNTRYEQLLPMIVTSNLGMGELAGVLGDRMASRLAGLCGKPVTVGGSDRRLGESVSLRVEAPERYVPPVESGAVGGVEAGLIRGFVDQLRQEFGVVE